MAFKFEFKDTSNVKSALDDGPMEPTDEQIREAIKEALRGLGRKLKELGGATIELTATIDAER